eukprot:scaffold21581_cov132-Skeletonema_marinoi.AAC.2
MSAQRPTPASKFSFTKRLSLPHNIPWCRGKICVGEMSYPSRRDTNAEEIISEATSADDGLPATFAIKSLHRQRNYDAIGE